VQIGELSSQRRRLSSESNDITERKRSEESLRTNENHMRTILESTADGILAVDNQGNITHTNSRFGEMWRVPSELLEAGKDEQMLNYAIEQLTDPDAFISKVKQLYESTEEDSDTLLFKDGRIFERFSSSLMSNGTIDGRVWSFRDITERKRAEELLHENEASLTALVEGVRTAIIVHDCTGKIILSNQRARQLLEPLSEDIDGRDLSDSVWRFFNEDGIEVPTEELPVTRILETQEAIEGHLLGLARKNSKKMRWLLVNGVPIVEKGGALSKVIMSFVDITDKVQAEESLRESVGRFRTLTEMAPVGVFLTDVDGKTIYWNQLLKKLTGMTDTECKGLGWIDAIHPDDRKRVVHAFSESIEKKSIFHSEYRFIHKNGKVTHTIGESRPIENDSGEITGHVGTITDITDLKLAEDEVLKSRKLESVGLLAGGIAHDFNNILTGLFGNIELVKRELPLEHVAYPYIQNSEKAREKATKLTQQLLTFAKGGDPLLEMVNIGQVIRDSIKFSLSGSNVITVLDLPDDLWQIKADKGQLSQVITNLVINSDQAMPDGGTMTIEAENIRDIDISIATHLSGEVIKLSISDDGAGISTENLKLIFDPYFTTKQAGSGLGLATIHSIITKHNGYINVVSELGIGTTFTIYLPADSSISQLNDATPSDEAEKQGANAGHILVMDDDEMILNLSTDIIETFGYTVDTAVDGKEAVEKYTAAIKSGKAFDVVIMDLTIPGGMGGKEAVQELLALYPQVKVIVSSGYSTDPVMANYRDYGFKGRLVKPFQMDDLQKELSLQIGKE